MLDGLCRVSVSRFYRDKRVFGMLQDGFCPSAQKVLKQGGTKLRI